MIRQTLIAGCLLISIAAQAQTSKPAATKAITTKPAAKKSATSKAAATTTAPSQAGQVNNTDQQVENSNKNVSSKWKEADKSVYYPDYYVFYDANKKGYVYQDSAHRWSFSEERPFFMKDADLGKANIQILKDQTMAMPDDQYEQYLRLYPAANQLPSVPVPILTVQPGKK